MESRVPARLTPAEGRKFGLLVGGAFLLLAALLWRRTHVTGATVAGKVTTPIFMSIIVFLVLTPAGFLVRLFGHRPLTHPRGAGTYWHSRPDGERRGALDHQF